MVLARLPDAPAGTRGLSLFLVPKILQDGSRNDVQCVSLEHKIGIHASPTCMLAFGEKEGAIGYLIGEANKGMATMFAMMNPARFAVGLEAIGVAGHACQLAHAYAAERVQGKVAGQVLPIAHHPDVAHMLLELRSHSEALRALALYAARHMDFAKHHQDETARSNARARVDLLIPVVKAHASQTAFDMCSTAMQVAGGMGYIEESGFPQLLRDVRVTMIYEGTNGIQALDLVSRKLPMQDYTVVGDFLRETEAYATSLLQQPELHILGTALQEGFRQLDAATTWVRQKQAEAATNQDATRQVQAIASPYLTLFGTVAQAYMLAREAQAAHEQLQSRSDYSEAFLRQKIETAEFFLRHNMPGIAGFKTRLR